MRYLDAVVSGVLTDVVMAWREPTLLTSERPYDLILNLTPTRLESDVTTNELTTYALLPLMIAAIPIWCWRRPREVAPYVALSLLLTISLALVTLALTAYSDLGRLRITADEAMIVLAVTVGARGSVGGIHWLLKGVRTASKSGPR